MVLGLTKLELRKRVLGEDDRKGGDLKIVIRSGWVENMTEIHLCWMFDDSSYDN